MPNLRNLNTGKQLVKQVLQQTGSRDKSVTKQVETNTQKPKHNKPKLPSKFSAKP